MSVSEAIPLTRVAISRDETEDISRLLRNADDGTAVEALEETVAAHLGRPWCVTAASGGTAVEIALAACDVHAGCEVILPAIGASAAIAATQRLGATPVCADVDPQSLCMRPEDAEKLITDQTRVIVGSTALGCPAGLDGMAALATRSELPMVEFVGGAFGAWAGGDRVGHFGRIAVFDLGPTSPLSTGVGGMMLTNDDHLASTMKALRNGERALSSEGTLVVRAAALDAPLDDLRASLGLARLGRIQATIDAREEVAATYIRRLGGNSDLILQTIPPAVRMGWCRMIVRLSDRFSADERDEIIAGLGRHEIESAPGVQLATDVIAPSAPGGGPWPVADRAARRAIALPFHSSLTEREVDLVCQTLELMMQRTSFRREATEEF